MNATTTVEALELEAQDAAQHKQLAPLQQSSMVSATTSMLQAAVQTGNIELVERMMALHERQLAYEARMAYVAAMAEFKKDPPRIFKEKAVSFDSKDGKQTTDYKHATLGSVVQAAIKGLAKVGISHAWSTEQLDGGRVAVTCTLTHCLGHKESVTLDAGKDDSGKKNNIQALGSAITYLQRYTLLAITGLATEDQDDDGHAAGIREEIVANKVLDGLLADIKIAGSDEAVCAIWDTGSKALQATGSEGALKELEDAVALRRGQLSYPADKFKQNKAAWVKVVQDGRKTVEELIVFLQAKHPLSIEQKDELRKACAPATTTA